MNTATQEQQIIDWFQGIWDDFRFNRPVRQEITDRVQEGIDLNRLGVDDLADIGELVWDDFSDVPIVKRDYPQPEIHKQSIDWEQFGDYLTDLLDVEPFEYDDEEDDW